MTTLYISTTKNVLPITIANKLRNKKIECQITPNMTVISNDNTYIVENGFKINIFDVKKEDFKVLIWDSLNEIRGLNLKCAHVKYYNEYRGCIMNWPGVFTENKCSM